MQLSTTMLGLALAALLLTPPVLAQQAVVEPSSEAAVPTKPSLDRLPPPSVTEHELSAGGRVVAFRATAGAVTLRRPDGAPEADIAFVSYAAESDIDATRPVTFVVNGGPGAASAYLQFGALGPWRLPLDGASPSRQAALIPNAEGWLDFTDLVFIDPVGAGYSRLVEPDDALRDRYLSIDGDIDALARFVLQWLGDNGRTGDPVHFVGESYGAFRGPLLAERLQTEYGVGLYGLILVSPVLDFVWRTQPDNAPLPQVALLPSFAATAMEKSGSFSETALDAVEAYAADDYMVDLMRGVGDADAVDRLVDRVSEITGLPPDFLEQSAARLSVKAFAHEIYREDGRFASYYDASVSSAYPDPADRRRRRADPVLDALTAPLTAAAVESYGKHLDWRPDRRYVLLNRDVNRGWDWGDALDTPESVGALGRSLALDPDLRVLIVHGYTDLVTPYFASDLILRQMEGVEPGGRIELETYRGGHMFYTRDQSRRAFTEDARRLYQSEDAAQPDGG